jgi:hypothetical protein
VRPFLRYGAAAAALTARAVDYRSVSLVTALSRIAEIRTMLTAPGQGLEPSAGAGTATASFVQLLSPALQDGEADSLEGLLSGLPALSTLGLSDIGLDPATLTSAPAAAGTAGERALAIAAGEVGQAEIPPGSNEGPAIARYRAAVAGSYGGAPWCAYFVSWAAAQAGAPLGESGEGYGAVEQIHDWAVRTGRLLPAGAVPQLGDIVLYGGRHVGIVEAVNPDGSLTTIEGNYQNRVGRVHRSPSEATGFVRL